jgi:tetrahydromethanopterin S-methyltransferase subunit G
MSDASLDLREQIVRIDEMTSRIERQQAETQKFVAEQYKLMAEGKKFGRDLWLIPLTILGAVVAGVMARLPEILRAFGVGP